MKKTFLVTLLVVLVFGAALLTAKDSKTGNYQKIETFMMEYYNAFNLYAQDAANIDRMDEYWAPEFLTTLYLPLPQYPVMDRFTWKNFMVFAHLNVLETLTIDEMSIDTRNLTVVARLTIEFHDRVTGDLVLKADGTGPLHLWPAGAPRGRRGRGRGGTPGVAAEFAQRPGARLWSGSRLHARYLRPR